MDWKQPTATNDGFFVVGADADLFLIDASDPQVLRKAAQTTLKGTLKLGLAAIEGTVYAIINGQEVEKLISVRADDNRFAPLASVELSGRSLAGPWTSGDLVFVRLDNGRLACFDSNLTNRWSMEISDGSLAASPQVAENMVQLFFQDGRLVTLNAETGAVLKETGLGQPIVHLPVNADSWIFFAGRDGTIHRVDLSAD